VGIQEHEAYNDIKINKTDFYRASSARRSCTIGSVAHDAQLSASLHQGAVPVLDTQVIAKVQNDLRGKGVTVARVAGEEEPSGYAAIGAFTSDKKSFRNFEVPADSVRPDGSIAPNTTVQARWSVYLRANYDNTEEGRNPIFGIIAENAYAKVLKSFPSVRGQTWAAVKLVNCPAAR
jgi:hypothetical protein